MLSSLKSGVRHAILFSPPSGFPGIPFFTKKRFAPHVPPMRSNILLQVLCLMLCLAFAACRSAADPAESGVMSEVLEIEGCMLPVPCLQVTAEVFGTLPEPVRAEAKKYCGRRGTAVVVSSLRPRYFRLIRSQERLLLGSAEAKPGRNVVYLSVIDGLGEAADSIRSIKIENPDSPDPWDLGIFIKRYPSLAGRIAELPPDDERLSALRPAARELLSRGSTKVMLERHSRTKDPAALEAAAHAEQEQIVVLEELLSSN